MLNFALLMLAWLIAFIIEGSSGSKRKKTIKSPDAFDDYVTYDLPIEVPEGYTVECHKWRDDGALITSIGHKNFKRAYYYKSYTEKECIEKAYRVFERGLAHYL